tara:strand:- start:12 stop:344 length:333 start_codon:yes stop_codon:yes gene_type:complete
MKLNIKFYYNLIIILSIISPILVISKAEEGKYNCHTHNDTIIYQSDWARIVHVLCDENNDTLSIWMMNGYWGKCYNYIYRNNLFLLDASNPITTNFKKIPGLPPVFGTPS